MIEVVKIKRRGPQRNTPGYEAPVYEHQKIVKLEIQAVREMRRGYVSFWVKGTVDNEKVTLRLTRHSNGIIDIPNDQSLPSPETLFVVRGYARKHIKSFLEKAAKTPL